jgi:ribosomal protein S18 acetylase RimI-like enzyme
MSARSGYYLKIPFVWEPGCPVPSRAAHLRFRTADSDWLAGALSSVLATSPDPSVQLALSEYGPHKAAAKLLALSSPHFEQLPECWQLAETAAGQPIGFVLPSAFVREPRNSLREGTIFYLGVLPEHRGKGYGHELLAQATRVLRQVGVWRILCDTAACNRPMIAVFRAAGYIEREPWERPLL